MEKLTFTVREVAELLGVGKISAYELANRADFPAIRIGRRIIIPKDALMRWIDAQTEHRS